MPRYSATPGLGLIRFPPEGTCEGGGRLYNTCMSARFLTTRHLSSAEDTAALAQALAPMLRPGDTLLLAGRIGAGKTHFARALIQARLAAAGRTEDVPSPTYTLVQVYDDGIAELWHADLYRLTGPDETHELGLEEAFEGAICLVEWPDRLGDLAPSNALRLRLALGKHEAARVLTIEAEGGGWEDRIKALLGQDAECS